MKIRRSKNTTLPVTNEHLYNEQIMQRLQAVDDFRLTLINRIDNIVIRYAL
jgi:hypothetical protein